MKKKSCFLFRHLSSSSCFLNHRYYSFLTATSPTTTTTLLNNLSNPNPYFGIGGIAAAFSSSTQGTTTTTTKTTCARRSVTIYLMERLGFTEEQSLAISKKILRHRDVSSTACDPQVTDLISFEKADNVITFLQESCGLDLSQVSKVITKRPRVLTSNVDKTLRPKVKLLQDLGFSTSDLALVFSSNPRLYLECDLSPAIQALRGIMGSDENVVKFFRQLSYGTSNKLINNLIPNVDLLENEYGIPRDKLRKFLTSTPKALMWRTDWLRDVLVRVEDKWGISRGSTEFLRALYVFGGFSDDNINSKCQVFRSYGWSDSIVMSLIKRYPECLGLSEATIKKKLDFYMNELGYKPAYLASRPALLGYSLENRVVPRHKVLTVLKEKGLIRVDYQLYIAIIFTENVFLNNFIIPFEGVVPNLRKVFVNGRAPCEAELGRKASENGAHQR